MRRLLLLLVALALSGAADAQEFSTRAIREFNQALTAASRFGVPRWATTALPTCNAANTGAIAFDSTALAFKGCNGSAWASIGGATVGGAVGGGTNNTVLYIDNSGNLGSEAALGYTAADDTLRPTTLIVSGATTFNNVATISTDNNFVVGATNLGVIGGFQTPTPDGMVFKTGSLANSINVHEFSDNFDFNNGPCGTVACTDPQFVVHSHNQDVTQYAGLSAFGISGGGKKTLPDTTGTAVFQVAVASDTGVGGVVIFTDFASDGTIQQNLTGAMQFAAVAEGTTVTCPSPTAVGTNLNAVTTGTLTCAFTCTAGTNTATINFGCNPSLTLGSQTLTWFVLMTSAGQVTPQ